MGTFLTPGVVRKVEGLADDVVGAIVGFAAGVAASFFFSVLPKRAFRNAACRLYTRSS